MSTVRGQADENGFEKSNMYGEGGKKRTIEVPLNKGGKREIIRYYDPNGIVRETKTTDVDNNGKNITLHEFKDCQGRPTYYERTVTDAKTGAELFYEQVSFERGGNKIENPISSGYRQITNEKGESTIYKYNKQFKEWEKVEKQEDSASKRISFERDPTTCAIGYPFGEFFGGYSFLHADFDPKNEALHGWAASFFYNLNKRWSLGIFGSSHYKSKDDLKVNMSFLQAALKYSFYNNDYAPKPLLVPYVYVGAGIGTFHSEVTLPGFPKFESDETSFAGALGAGLNLRIAKQFNIRPLQLDYIFTDFNDKPQNNFRATTGVAINLGELAIKF